MVAYTIVMKWWWKKLLEEIKWELISFHPETSSCHSEPFSVLRINSVKNLCGPTKYEILRRLAPKNDIQKQLLDNVQENYHAAPESS